MRQERANPEKVPEGTVGSGENVCRRCGGSGRVEIGGWNRVCPDCHGSGAVATPIGGG